MIDFALLLFKDQNIEETKHKRFFKKILLSVQNFFKNKEINIDFKKLDLYDGRAIYFIQLPFAIEEVVNMSIRQLDALERAILSFCKQHSIGFCIYPKKLDINFKEEVFVQSFYSGDFLYKSLLRKVIEYVYEENATFLSNSDIVVISGNYLSETEIILEMLAPSVKYLTVVVSQEEDINNSLERIYEETGLSIAVSSDLATIIKNADIIINLADTRLKKRTVRMKGGALLINYGTINGIAFTVNNAVINGLEFNFPKLVPDKKLIKEAYRFYTESELLEMIILSAAGYVDDRLPEFLDKTLVLRIKEEFIRSGIKITGFKGLYSQMKRKDLLQLLNIT